MRTFRLVNGAGESCNITDRQLFFHDPSGLGFNRQLKYRQVGDRFVRVSSKVSQQDITGKVALLGDDPYLSYFNFVQFLNKEPLTLLYTPNDQASASSPSGTTYRRNVNVKKVDKTEMEHQGYLDCSISLTPLTPWYKYVAVSNGNIDTSEVLHWGVTWGVDWGPLNEYERGIVANSSMASPSKITIYGPITNPSWTHYVNGIAKGTGKVLATIDTNEYLLVDCTVDPYRILKVSALNDMVLSDLYEYSDFSTKRFVELQNGVNTLAVSGDNAIDPTVKWEAYIYYESV